MKRQTRPKRVCAFVTHENIFAAWANSSFFFISIVSTWETHLCPVCAISYLYLWTAPFKDAAGRFICASLGDELRPGQCQVWMALTVQENEIPRRDKASNLWQERCNLALKCLGQRLNISQTVNITWALGFLPIVIHRLFLWKYSRPIAFHQWKEEGMTSDLLPVTCCPDLEGRGCSQCFQSHSLT